MPRGILTVSAPSPEPPPEHRSTMAVNGGLRRSTSVVNVGPRCLTASHWTGQRSGLDSGQASLRIELETLWLQPLMNTKRPTALGSGLVAYIQNKPFKPFLAQIPSGESKVHIKVLSVLWGNRLPIHDGSLPLSRYVLWKPSRDFTRPLGPPSGLKGLLHTLNVTVILTKDKLQGSISNRFSRMLYWMKKSSMMVDVARGSRLGA
ncbi:hypothetical protein Tco_0654230 [Tanacetum coccineum]|uniref:Uncharacterized protein n=1 Tax=Tanacetum coccineum TaxID=301880 RepID=A0ABQ4X3L6_9ASTR